MRIRRHLPPLSELRLPAGWRLPRLPRPTIDRRSAVRWAAIALGVALAGYLTAALVIFPTPLLAARQDVPRVLGLPRAAAAERVTGAGLKVADGGSEPHPTVAAGSVVWQDPPPGVRATEGTTVTLITSGGPPRVPVPDLAGYDGELAKRFMRAAGLVVSRVESVQAPTPRGVTVLTRPPAPAVATPGSGVVLVVSQGAPTIAVPDLLGLLLADARTRLELDGLQVGSVTRRRTAEAVPGTVVAQRPAAGTLAAPGTVIDIVIARSP